ncbi:MAG: zinc carboxypeptidase [Chitinophagaceae bacterium]|nr:zinc carboxypeptidase [Chitinophagaceae bacterium]
MRKIGLVFLLLFCTGSLIAQLKSPDEFLGYSLGSRYTVHHRIVEYFQQAAAAMPRQVKLERYGQTYEGRELLIAIVASSVNMQRIEEIRKNNLRLTGLLTDKPADPAAPAIVWLSYNVHGNEPSSSEVSMKTLYALLDPSNAQAPEWLKNTVVIIDPCINPDGRDRYVNWFNQVVGNRPDANPDGREHSEPWPGGRSNHYNFDLNRDWAWQTQLESRQRIRIYNNWMPQIHCDFHEQYPNSPYYFAPAAEPFHEVITPWQREFQTTIGKNHARYFDANGWLYFTREYFDLFYPAYGDTYPTYSGAIGMTYEQAGHNVGGLTYLKSDGDTLTLKDRIAHHFTTSMSTVEITSANAAKVISGFKRFFDDALTRGSGEYRSYVVTSNDPDKLNALKSLLTSNDIRFGNYFQAGAKGYNYFTGKEESISLETHSIVINSLQPRSALIQVLFEPRSKLSDSATYDITAWSLPYAYGLKSYAVRSSLPASATVALPVSPTTTAGYGYLLKYQSFSDAVLLARLLQNGFKVRFAESEFSLQNKNYSRGTLIILRSGNERIFGSLPGLLTQYHASADAVESGFTQSGFDFGSDKVHLIRKPRVALLTGNSVSSTAAGEVWHLFDQLLDFPVTLINAEELGGVNWKNIDVLILPDGNYKMLTEKDGAYDLKTWVRQGGRIIAMENAAAQLAAGEWGFKLKKTEEDTTTKKPYVNLRKYASRERDRIVNNVPGAIYKMELDNTHPLAFGYPDFYFTLKQQENLYEFMKDGWNVGVLKKDDLVSGFVGSKARDRIKDGTGIGVVNLGNGSVTFFADNPVFRAFWENGKLMLLRT